MKIAAWNVNSVKARLEAALAWLKKADPDIVTLQEIKTTDATFPKEPFESAGYNCAVHGQKSYNGVAILSKRPIEDVSARLPGSDCDDHCRYLEAVIGGDGGTVRVASIYAPNGNPIGTEKFAYKLAWLDRLKRHAEQLLKLEEPVVLGGDFNIIPQDKDAANPKNWIKDALFQPEAKAAFRRLEYLGYADAFRILHPGGGYYTFWDYMAGSWQRNNGIRIDHLLLSPQAQDRLKACEIDKFMRESDKPSDHVPIWCELNI